MNGRLPQVHASCSLFLALFGPLAGLTADDYFQRAIERIKPTLEKCPDSYGFVMEEMYTDLRDKAKKPSKITYIFYTANGKVLSRVERFEGGEYKTPYMTNVLLVPGKGGDPRAVMSARGNTYHYVNLRRPSARIGRDDGYSSDAERPRQQPFQILVNPCFAPLPFTPEDILACPLVAKPDQDGNKVYQISQPENQYLKVVRLHFSPARSGALARTEYDVLNPDGTFLHRTSRLVEKWQEMPDGSSVPVQFKMEIELHGQPMSRIERKVFLPIIGKIDDAKFDMKNVPEFQVQPKQVWDETNRKQVTPSAKDQP